MVTKPATNAGAVTTATAATKPTSVIANENMVLRRVHVIFRHGARTPCKSAPEYFPAIQYDDVTMTQPEHTFVDCQLLDASSGADVTDEVMAPSGVEGGELLGQLTNSGALQLFELGWQLRSHYVDTCGLTGFKWNRDDVMMRSTKRRRALDSLRALLAGFYGKTGGETFPVIVERQKAYEVLCPSWRTSRYLRGVKCDTQKRCNDISGYHEAQLECQTLLQVKPQLHQVNMSLVNDYVKSHAHHGYLPEQYKNPRLLELLSRTADVATVLQFERLADTGHKSKMVRACIGRLVAMLAEGLDPASKTAKLSLYSTHGSCLVPLLMMLDAYPGEWLKFGAHVIMELWQDTEEDKWSVRVMYNWSVLTLPICAPSRLCPLGKFRALLSTYAMSKEEHDEICDFS